MQDSEQRTTKCSPSASFRRSALNGIPGPITRGRGSLHEKHRLITRSTVQRKVQINSDRVRVPASHRRRVLGPDRVDNARRDIAKQHRQTAELLGAQRTCVADQRLALSAAQLVGRHWSQPPMRQKFPSKRYHCQIKQLPGPAIVDWRGNGCM